MVRHRRERFVLECRNPGKQDGNSWLVGWERVKTYVTFYCLLVMPLTVLGATAQSPPAVGNAVQQPLTQTAQTEKCRVSGTVIAAATGALLEKAEVVQFPAQSGLASSYRTLSGGSGAFALDRVSPGKYELRVARGGYVPQVSDSSGGRHLAQVIQLPPGQAMTDLTVKLVAEGVITARVVDTDGEPLRNVQVQCERVTYGSNGKLLSPMNSASTNDMGEFRIFGLEPGKWYVSATRNPN